MIKIYDNNNDLLTYDDNNDLLTYDDDKWLATKNDTAAVLHPDLQVEDGLIERAEEQAVSPGSPHETVGV